MSLLIILVVGGLAAACLWCLLWGRSNVSFPPTGPAARAATSSRLFGHSTATFEQLHPLLTAVELRLQPFVRTRWGKAMTARDSTLIVRGGLENTVQPGQIFALRVALAGLAVGCAMGVVLIWLFVESLTFQSRGPVPVGAVLLIGMLAAFAGVWWPERWLSLRRASRQRAMLRALPFVLDLLTLSVESGASLATALGHAAEKGPQGPLRDEMARMLQEVRSGRSRIDALRSMAERADLPAVSNWVAAMISAQQQGSSLGPVLRAQADQRREERFLRAEKVAMKAPVKMLFPLLVFIFPCTFLLLFFPVAVRLVQEGLLR